MSDDHCARVRLPTALQGVTDIDDTVLTQSGLRLQLTSIYEYGVVAKDSCWSTSKGRLACSVTYQLALVQFRASNQRCVPQLLLLLSCLALGCVLDDTIDLHRHRPGEYAATLDRTALDVPRGSHYC
jgi:hypothetical protein